jgi:hypothetical protein
MGRPRRHALVDEGVFAPLQRSPHLGTQAGVGQWRPIGRGKLAIEPGRAVARDLPIEIVDRDNAQVRSPALCLIKGCGARFIVRWDRRWPGARSGDSTSLRLGPEKRLETWRCLRCRLPGCPVHMRLVEGDGSNLPKSILSKRLGSPYHPSSRATGSSCDLRTYPRSEKPEISVCFTLSILLA